MLDLFALGLALAAGNPTGLEDPAVRTHLDEAWNTAARRPSPTVPAAPLAPAATPPKATTTPAAPLSLAPADRSPAWAGGALVMVAGAAAVVMARRRRRAGLGGLQVQQAASLGKGRSLVVVTHAGRRLLLGVTDHGVQVLRDDEDLATPAAAPAPSPAAPAPLPLAATARDQLLGDVERQPTTRPPRGVAAFEQELEQRVAELSEDEDLRRKLAPRSRPR